MQIVFINYYRYEFSSGVHIHFLANELTRLGHECIVALPTVANTDNFGKPEYSFSDFARFDADLQAGRYNSNTIFHAWTPREHARIPTQLAAATLGAPYFVHLEDNERRLIESFCGKPFHETLRDAAAGTVDFTELGIHPILHQTFLAEACGVTLIMDTLKEFVPNNVPTQVIWPACEPEFFELPIRPDMETRRNLGIPGNAAVIVYPGNVHHANAHILEPLYKALPIVEAKGHPIRLVRCSGRDNGLSSDVAEIMERFVISNAELAPKDLPAYMGMADILVQPGSSNDFDNYRFPSKLPFFLASGRPVILAKTNLGRFLDDSENCLILEHNTPEAIASKIIWLLEHQGEAGRIGASGRAFAASNFNWAKSAKRLLNFYESYGHGRE